MKNINTARARPEMMQIIYLPVQRCRNIRAITAES